MPVDNGPTFDSDPSLTPADVSPDAAPLGSPYDLHGIPTSKGIVDWSLSPQAWTAVLIATLVLITAIILWVVLIAPGLRLRRKAARYGLKLPIGRAIRLGLANPESERLIGLWVRLRQANITDIGFDDLRAHHRAGGRVADVVEALMYARRCGVRFDWPALCRIDLAGENPSPIVNNAVRPRRIDVPGELLGGGALAAISGDGVELEITGSAEVISEPDDSNPLPRTAAMVANIAKVIVAYVHACRSHRTLLQEPTRLTDAVNAADLPTGNGMRLLRFSITRVQRGGGRTHAADAADTRARVKRMFAAQPPQKMTADELAALAPACVQLGDYEQAARLCRLALEREPLHERANMWLHETMHHAGAPLSEQLALAAACVERGVEPRNAWRLIRASILCRMATSTDPDTGRPRVVDADLYRRAADELRQLTDSDDRLVERAHAGGWIDDWAHAFPGLEGRLPQTPVDGR